MLFVSQAAEDKQLGALRQTVQLAFRPESYPQVVRNGMVLYGQLNILSGTKRLRIVARDVSSGLVGSVTIPIGQVLSRNTLPFDVPGFPGRR